MEKAERLNDETKTAEFETVLLPGRLGSTEIQDYLIQQKDSVSRADEVIQYINKIPTEVTPEPLKIMGKVLQEIHPYYKNRFTDIAKSKSVFDEIKQLFGDNLICFEKDEFNNDEFIPRFRKLLRHMDSPVIFIGQRHDQTYETLYSAMSEREMNEIPNVAMIVMDSHTDVFRPAKKTIDESNVMLALVGNDIAKRAVFIGPNEASNYTVKRANKFLDPTGETNYFELIATQDTDNLPRRVLMQRVENQISDLLLQYKHDGITNLIFSIDADVLMAKRFGYTAFQYNPLVLLNRAAEVTLPDIPADKAGEEEADRIYFDLLIGLEHIFKLAIESKEDFQKNFKRLKRRSILRNPITKSLSSSANYDPNNLRLTEIAKLLNYISGQSKELGLEIGIGLRGGGKFIGDITGLEGFDYRGRTAKATRVLANRLAKAAIS